jgi:hypothetical protein
MRKQLLFTLLSIICCVKINAQSRCGTGTVTVPSGTSSQWINWYQNTTDLIPVATGSVYTTPTITNTTTYYATLAKTVETPTVSSFGSNGGFFDMNVLNSIKLTNFAIQASISGSAPNKAYEIYYRVGSYAGFESNSAGWTLLASGTTPLLFANSLVQLPKPFAINLSAGQTYGFLIVKTDFAVGGFGKNMSAATGSIVSSDANLQLVSGKDVSGWTSMFSSTGMFASYMFGCAAVYETIGSIQTPKTATINPAPNVTVNSGAICLGQSFTMVPSGADTYTYSNGSAVVSPTSNASYDVTGTSAFGCVSSNTAVSTVTVNALPTISVNSGTICAGESFTMTPSGADTYTYSNGSSVATPTVDATYNVSGTDANGCVSNLDAVASVTVNALPVIVSESGDVTVCGDATGTFSISATNATQYEWGYSNGGSTTMIDGSYGEIGYTTTVMEIPTLETQGWDTYDITCLLTSAEGCTLTSAPKLITVNALPIISVNSGAICAGASFTIEPTGADTFTITGGLAVVSPTAETTYSVSGTNTLTGCVSNVDAEATVLVNQLPSLDAVSSNSLLCTGETATLTALGAATSYTWSTTENTFEIAVTPTVQTTYTVDGTDDNGCVNTATITQDVTICTGFATIANNTAAINLYPNPTKGQFTVEVTTKSTVIVTNALGQVLVNETMESGKHSLDISKEATGVYFVKVIENNKQQIIKVVKQ